MRCDLPVVFVYEPPLLSVSVIGAQDATTARVSDATIRALTDVTAFAIGVRLIEEWIPVSHSTSLARDGSWLNHHE